MRRVVPPRIIHSGERLVTLDKENSVNVVKRRVDTPYCLCRKVATLRIISNRNPMTLCNVFSGVDTKRTWRKHEHDIENGNLIENGHGHKKYHKMKTEFYGSHYRTAGQGSRNSTARTGSLVRPAGQGSRNSTARTGSLVRTAGAARTKQPEQDNLFIRGLSIPLSSLLPINDNEWSRFIYIYIYI